MSNVTQFTCKNLCVPEKRNREDDEAQELSCEAACSVYIPKDRHTTSFRRQPICASRSHRIGGHMWRLETLFTHKNWREKGVATAHLGRLMQLIKKRDPHAIALFFEIPSRFEKKLPLSKLIARSRIARFFENSGAQAWPGKLLIAYEGYVGDKLYNQEIMWIPICGAPSEKNIDSFLHYLLFHYSGISSEHSLYKIVMNQKFPTQLPTILTQE